ncbi:MAG: teneurin-3 [Blautia sp.]|nr:teneurin-3 [Blautia sp.]
MSKTSMKERNKAIRKKWEIEQQLVQEGKGTRDWTKEQQADILDPEKGKAYDDQGRAFEGQHMKSAAEYPDYQGDPDNIQFLTKEEHLEAHKGSWQNPTNWYYDPVTKEYHDFGNGGIIPCKVIELSEPIVVTRIADTKESLPNEQSEKDKNSDNCVKTENDNNVKAPPIGSELGNSERIHLSGNTEAKNNGVKKIAANSSSIHKTAKSVATPKSNGKFVKGLKAVGSFIVNHPVESIEIAGVVIGGTIKVASSIAGSRHKSSINMSNTRVSNSKATSTSEIIDRVSEIVEQASRAMPSENDVSAHKQRYHTKSGIVWKDKAPYHRGGKG